MNIKPLISAAAVVALAAVAAPNATAESWPEHYAPMHEYQEKQCPENEEQLKATAQAAIDKAEKKAGHRLVDLRITAGNPVLAQVDSYDPETDDVYFNEIVQDLKDAGYDEIVALAPPAHAEAE